MGDMTVNPDGRTVVVRYSDATDAYEVAQVLIDAGLRRGKIIDQGFYEDGHEIARVASEIMERG